MKNQMVNSLKGVELVSYFNGSNFKMKQIEEIPFVNYPNGYPCFLVNSYLLTLNDYNRSYYTIRQKANNLTHVIKYCFERNIDFYDLFESDLLNLSNQLMKETNEEGVKKRTANTVIDIIKSTLDFLFYIGDINGDYDFVFNQIGAEKKEYNIALSDKDGFLKKLGWVHKAIPLSEPKKKRHPISQNNIDKLYEAIGNAQSSKYLKQRRIQMLKLLEVTGARAGEIAKLKVEDVFEAIEKNDNLIKMRTLKKKNSNSIRYVPITDSDLYSLSKFIKIYRAKIIKNTIGKISDTGFVFINEKTGEAIVPATISNELTILKNESKIEEKVCAHMFRHRFITKLFVKLIKQYNYENLDSFKNALLDVNSLKQQIQQVTGHTRITSLDEYIDLAFKEINNFNEVQDKLKIADIYESYDRNINLLIQDLENGIISTKEYIERQKDLEKLKNKELKKND
tara:strand:+ start:17954 stop:19312 length:1359 start_codon:yes stop_codon:yes gene_type:complete